jgi:hypothetical protein
VLVPLRSLTRLMPTMASVMMFAVIVVGMNGRVCGGCAQLSLLHQRRAFARPRASPVASKPRLDRGASPARRFDSVQHPDGSSIAAVACA